MYKIVLAKFFTCTCNNDKNYNQYRVSSKLFISLFAKFNYLEYPIEYYWNSFNTINPPICKLNHQPSWFNQVEMVEILQVWKNNWKKPKTCRTTVIYDLRESEILYWKSCWEEQLTEKLCLVQQARLRGKIRCARVDGILIDLKFNLKKPFKTDGWKENLFNLIKLTSSSILRQLSLVNSLFFLK